MRTIIVNDTILQLDHIGYRADGSRIFYTTSDKFWYVEHDGTVCQVGVWIFDDMRKQRYIIDDIICHRYGISLTNELFSLN